MNRNFSGLVKNVSFYVGLKNNFINLIKGLIWLILTSINFISSLIVEL